MRIKQGKETKGLAVNVATMANIDDDHKEPGLKDTVNNAIASNSVGIKTLERSFQCFSLKRICFQRVENIGNALIETPLKVRDAPQDGFGLSSQF